MKPTARLWRNKYFYASLVLLLIGAFFDMRNSDLIHTYFPLRQPIPDSLFMVLPYLPWTQNWTDLANIFSAILLGFYLFPKRWDKVPFALTVLGLGYLLRSLLILLNPFGGPLGNVVNYGLTNIHQYGQFPSGHTFFVVAVYLFINRLEDPLLKRLALLSCAVEIVALLLSHGHYSIDIVGGILVGYFTYNEVKKYEAKLTV